MIGFPMMLLGASIIDSRMSQEYGFSWGELVIPIGYDLMIWYIIVTYVV